MMCPNDNRLPRWLCTERECEAAELKSRPVRHAGMDHRPIGEIQPIPDWPTEKKHPMMTIKGITYMLEYNDIFYSVASSWNMEDGSPNYTLQS